MINDKIIVIDSQMVTVKEWQRTKTKRLQHFYRIDANTLTEKLNLEAGISFLSISKRWSLINFSNFKNLDRSEFDKLEN